MQKAIMLICLASCDEKLGRSMSEKPETSEAPEQPRQALPEKLMIDDASDFQFHAAYLAYSQAFDKTSSEEGKKLLNNNLCSLQRKEIDYSMFYRNISQYRGPEANLYIHNRPFIATQKKQEWRRKTQKQERIKRHRK